MDEMFQTDSRVLENDAVSARDVIKAEIWQYISVVTLDLHVLKDSL